MVVSSISTDGKHLAYTEFNKKTGADIWILPIDLSDPEHPNSGQPEPFLRPLSQEYFPALSPDGQWMHITRTSRVDSKFTCGRFDALPHHL
jgi:hypothetical protein